MDIPATTNEHEPHAARERERERDREDREEVYIHAYISNTTQ
jgi:hypothetical protein